MDAFGELGQKATSVLPRKDQRMIRVGTIRSYIISTQSPSALNISATIKTASKPLRRFAKTNKQENMCKLENNG